MSLIGKPIEEVIETLYNSIKSKRQVIDNLKKEYNIDTDNSNEIKINRLKLIDLLDEFEVTISQSLQAIQTLKVEIFNIKEKQTTEEILNLTNELQIKYNNTNETNNNNNNNNILDKLEYSKTENSINDQNNNLSKNKNSNYQNYNKNNINDNNNNQNFNINSIIETKLNFDYSSLLNNSELSLKNSLSNLDKYRIDHEQENNIINEKIKNNNTASNDNKNNLIIIKEKELNQNQNNNNIFNKINEKNLEQINNKEENIATNVSNKNNINANSKINLKDEEIEEDQPSKLNVNITPVNNEFFNKLQNFSGNRTGRQDISYLSDNNNNNIIKYNNKFNSSRQIESNHNKTYNFNFLSNINDINDSNNKNDNLFFEKSFEKNNINNINQNCNKSNDDINYKRQIKIKDEQKINNLNINNIQDIGIEDYSIKEDIINNDMDNNFDESDIISIVSKKDILLEKLKKIEEEEKFRKLIEEVFSVKSFKLYILDKFGQGKYDIFIKKYKNGEINKTELESELNVLKELSLKNSNNKKNDRITKKVVNKNKYNNNANNTMDNKFNTENNFSKTAKYKKINYNKNMNNTNKNIKNLNTEGEYNGPLNFKNTLRDGNNSAYNTSISFSNQSKNKNSHSVNSIRARLKNKNFK